MAFTDKDKQKALAIVHIFETGKPFGDPSACVVLNDGAGISYGISQFTHRSGSLAAVVSEYLARGGQTSRQILTARLGDLTDTRTAVIDRLSRDTELKNALKAAGRTPEMLAAQHAVAERRYLRPAIAECERRFFVTPLALAVVFDSLTHGSWETISTRVRNLPVNAGSPLEREKRWITEYVRARHAWLTSVRRLSVTNYRTRFFLAQIAIANWTLALPLDVHGVRLTQKHFEQQNELARENTAEQPEAPSLTDAAGTLASAAASGFDRLDGLIQTAIRRTDSAKSLWTTVGGSISQAAWAMLAFVAGLPRYVWLGVAAIAGALMLLYLYRQIVLGRIRELHTTTTEK